jgi:hypothetical protein
LTALRLSKVTRKWQLRVILTIEGHIDRPGALKSWPMVKSTSGASESRAVKTFKHDDERQRPIEFAFPAITAETPFLHVERPDQALMSSS